MLTIFNRKELITTMDMQRQANIRSVLSANGIAYTVRTENLQGSSALGGRSRGSSGSFGIDPNYSYEYHIYVHKNDYENALRLIRVTLIDRTKEAFRANAECLSFFFTVRSPFSARKRTSYPPFQARAA